VRRRLVFNTILVSMMVLLVLATPVILLIKRASEDELRSRLRLNAKSVASAFQDEVRNGDPIPPIDLIGLAPEGDRIEIYNSNRRQVVALGDEISGGFSETEAISGGGRVVVETDGRDLRQRLTRQFTLLGVLAAGGTLLTAVLAAIFGARVSRPLEQLAASAGRLGAGDFSAALPPPSGIREIDDIRNTLAASASRLDQTLSAERSFTGDATHQLRTGLTGIALQLQLLASHQDPNVRADATQALHQTDRMTATLDELLDLARGGRGSQRMTVHLHDIALEHRGDWLQRFQLARRGLICQGTGSAVIATPGFIGQIIDILLDNSLKHGRGDVRIDISGRQLQVSDEGILPVRVADGLFRGSDDPAAPHGRGLALGRRLAQADGGSLELIARAPTTFVLSMPVAHPGG
jgi:signal transduction histidine kinase